jgi:integrase
LTLTKENIVDDRIVFRRKKTHKVYSIQIQEKTKDILNYYASSLPKSSNEFLLPFVKQRNNPTQLKKDILQAIKTCNKYLANMAIQCKIDKPITTYYARYSWANIAKSIGYSKDLIAEALGHEYGNKVTGIYLDHYDNATIDSMNNKVILAVFGKK